MPVFRRICQSKTGSSVVFGACFLARREFLLWTTGAGAGAQLQNSSFWLGEGG